MERSPYLIIKEFSNSANEQHRRNAGTALAVLGEEESLAELLRLALHDPVPAVRQWCENEILSLEPATQGTIIEAAKEKIRTRASDQHEAYLLLGRLRERGVRFRLPAINILRRLQLAQGLRGVEASGRLRGIGRGLWPAAQGALGGGVVIAVLMGGPFRLGLDASELMVELFLGTLVGIVLGALAIVRSSPIGRQADPWAAILVDVGCALVSSAALSLLLTVFVEGADRTWRVLLCIGLMLPACAVATRLFMLLVMGSRRGRLGNYWIEILCGSAAGIFAVSLLPALLEESGVGFISSLWLVALPVASAIAVAFAWVDAQAETLPLTPRFVRVAGFVPAAGIIAAVAVLLLPPVSRPAGPAPSAVIDTGSPSDRHVIPIFSVPVAIPITTLHKQTTSVWLGHPGPGTLSYELHGANGAVEFRGAEGAPVKLTLDAGAHQIVIRYSIAPTGQYGTKVNAAGLLAVIFRHLRREPWPPLSKTDSIATLTVTFNIS